jgi:hypothetical protein
MEPQTSPYAAAPEKLASPVPSPEQTPDDMEFIKTNLLPMDTAALDKFFQDNGLSPEEQEGIKSIIESMRSQPAQPMAETPMEAPAQQPAESLPPQAVAGQYTNLKPSELLEKIGSFGRDIAIGAMADLPAMGAGMGAAAATAAIPGGAPFAPFVGFGVGATTAALGTTEATENLVREAIGLKPVEYGGLETGLAAISGGLAGVGVRAAKTIAGKESKEAIKGALEIRQSAQKIFGEIADSKGLSEKAKQAYVQIADQTLAERGIAYEIQGYSRDVAAKKALEDVPAMVKAEEYIEQILGNVPDIPQAKFERLEPGVASFTQMEAASKGRMTQATATLDEEVNKGIELAKRGKVSYETARALRIPQEEVVKGFEALLTAATPSLPKLANGDSVIFKAGEFISVGKNGKVRRFTPANYREFFGNAIEGNDYLKTLIGYYNQASAANFRAAAAGKGRAVALPPTSQTLGQLAELRRMFAANFPIDATGAAGLANRRAYGTIKSLEDKYLNVLADSEIPSLAMAASEYRNTKELSELAASSFKEFSSRVTADPQTIGTAILSVPNEYLEKFVKLKRGEAAMASQVVDEDLPQYMARQVLQQKFGTMLFGSEAGKVKSAIPTRERILQIPKVYEDIVADKNLSLKMKTLLGADTWSSMMRDLKKASDTFTDIGQKLLIAKEKNNEKAIAALQTNGAAVLLNLMNQKSPTRLAFFGKSLSDFFGDPVIKKRVNEVVFSRYLPEMVNAISSPRMAAETRAQIIQTFGKDSPVAMKILTSFDEGAQRKLVNIQNVKRSLVWGSGKALTSDEIEQESPAGQPQRAY